MTTLKDKAAEYAERIRMAALLCEVKTASTRSTEAFASASETILSVLRDMESLTYAGGKSLTPDQVDQLLLETDVALEVEPGTMRIIKEGSVRALLRYNQLVTQLMQTLMAKR